MATIDLPAPCGLSALMEEPITPGLRVGLLGGSFNPAHDGHLHISVEAMRRLGLDQIWWLVSPQNPLKPQEDMGEFTARFESARAMATHPKLRVTDLESQLGLTYTVDTLTALTSMGPQVHFVWLMGADNLIQMPRWRDWQKIVGMMPIAVLARPGYNRSAPLGTVATRFVQNRIPAEKALLLADLEPPAWVFLPIPLHPASSTAVRAKKRQ